LATKGRARIELQKKVELTNIEQQRQENLKRLNMEYATADKAKTSFGYTGITFLVILFGSIFLNDLLKLCIYYCDGLKEWGREKKDKEEEKRKQDEVKSDEIRLDIIDSNYVDDLEKGLEKVYF